MTSTPSQTRTPRSPWWGVASLGVTLFALVTSEFLPASLLPLIATDLGISPGLAGQSVAATAIMGAIAGPAVGVLFPRVGKRRLMLTFAALAVASNLLVAIAPGFIVLLLARLLLGAALAGFWSVAIAIVAQLVTPEHLGRGLTVVNIGVSAATVAAVPLGAYLGELWGWRVVVLLAAGAALVALALVAVWLPGVPATPGAGARALLATVRAPIVIVGLIAIAMVAGGPFAAFTYIRPALARIQGLDAAGLGLLLLAFGVAAFIGNLAGGPLSDSRLRLLVLAFPALIAAATVTIALGGESFSTAVVAVILWGLGFGAMPTALQTWLARAAPDHLDAVGGLLVTVFQLAIAIGAGVGGALVDGLDVRAAFIAGGFAAAIGGIVLAARLRRPAAAIPAGNSPQTGGTHG
jgi:predicted MFS family arabinose efflux permease